MYQRSLKFCKQPAVVVVNGILLTEIAETYGLRQEKGWYLNGVQFRQGPQCHVCDRMLSDNKRHGSSSNADDFFFFLFYIKATWLTKHNPVFNRFTFILFSSLTHNILVTAQILWSIILSEQEYIELVITVSLWLDQGWTIHYFS